MKNLLTIAFIVGLSMPALANNFSVVENVSFDGTITVVKNSKKYRNVQACQAYCDSRSSCAAFVLDLNAGTCTLLKNVKDQDANEGVISGTKS